MGLGGVGELVRKWYIMIRDVQEEVGGTFAENLLR
jgi:hypothetical protein